jgi:hypothetical protein
METTYENQPVSHMDAQPARPQFLSVLCILTWVCCSLIFISTIWGVIFQPSPEKQLEEIERIRTYSPEAADKMEEVFERQSSGGGQVMNTVLTLIALGLSAFGAYMMWQLKKTGFYLYVAGELIPYVGFLFGGTEALSAAGSMSGMGDAFVGMAIGIMLVFDVLFIVLYGLNLKHMKK